MVEPTDAEGEALLRPVTTLGEPSTYAGPASSWSNAVVSTHRSERIVGNSYIIALRQSCSFGRSRPAADATHERAEQ